MAALFSICIGLNSSIDGVTQELCGKWLELGLMSFNMCFSRDARDNLIQSDGELHSLACYCFAKKIQIIEINLVVCESLLITSNHASSSSCVGGGEVVAYKTYKSDFWWHNLGGGVGQ
ncbi:hypothetical protein IFM89_028927 [Coptis chinensis]|uniref:Uncharacterized protein n=1 Tax=Coptis chinensis TaxID=261450 RepID=A0A835H8H4_9MAGN|nr:hypothetical protein IFM89_028927 [Coptis chinensis]